MSENRSPDEAQRNPGPVYQRIRETPDCAALHPGYGTDYAPRTTVFR